MLALCLMLSTTYYVHNYAGIIGLTLITGMMQEYKLYNYLILKSVAMTWQMKQLNKAKARMTFVDHFTYITDIYKIPTTKICIHAWLSSPLFL